MENHFDTSKGPRIYLPPPLLYVIPFILALLIQHKIPMDSSFFSTTIIKGIGIALCLVTVFFLFTSLRQFFITKNTLIPFLRAKSLQTTGVYAITRNPMYLGLALAYLALTCFIGNWWNIILFPVLILIVQETMIKKEERYLTAEFGQTFLDYMAKVRRWI